MATGGCDISVSTEFLPDMQEDDNNKNEGESKNHNFTGDCLNTGFRRSLSLHDRPLSTGVATNKHSYKFWHNALVSSSLEQIPSNILPSPDGRSLHSPSVGICSDAEVNVQSPIYNASSSVIFQQTDQDQLPETDDLLEDRCHARFGVESEKLLEKTMTILKAVDKDISESLANLTKPKSIALESIVEIYKNRGENIIGSFNVSTESSNQQRFDDCQSVQPESGIFRPSTDQNPENMLAQSSQQSPKNSQSTSSQQNLKNLQYPFTRQRSKKSHSTSQQNPKNSKSQQSPKNSKSPTQQSPNSKSPTQQNPKILQSSYIQRILNNLQSGCTQNIPKKLQSPSTQQFPKDSQPQLSSNLENLQFSSTADLNDLQSAEQNLRNVSFSTESNAQDATSSVKSRIEFDLPSDHEQFVKMIGALQNRCLEYREMLQDVAVLALEECVNFAGPFIIQIRQLREQFESQKRNFKDFKVLCCKSVVFGPESQPINEQVTEVIQSSYLKLLQEENETFMARLEFGLEMAEMYAKMLKLEMENEKIITTLEREIFHMKLTSVGFKV